MFHVHACYGYVHVSHFPLLWTILLTIHSHMYYLPYFFVAVKEFMPGQTGLFSCAYLLSGSLTTFVVGAVITAIGCYTPFIWIGSVVFLASCPLYLLFHQTSSTAMLIGAQILSGVGFGSATQIPFIAVQVVLPKEDIAAGSEYLFQYISFCLLTMTYSSRSHILLQLLGVHHCSRN